MTIFKRREKQAIRIDKRYDGFNREPEFIIGNPERIAKTISDAKARSTNFAEMMAHEDGLPTSPSLSIETGSLGYADADLTTSIVARFIYTFNTNEKLSLGKAGSKFPIRWLLIFLIVAITLGSALVFEGFQDSANAFAELATDCTVFTKKGKPVYTIVFGERFYYLEDGSPRVVQREVTPFEKDRIEKPFVHCKWNSADGVTPPQLMW